MNVHMSGPSARTKLLKVVRSKLPIVGRNSREQHKYMIKKICGQSAIIYNVIHFHSIHMNFTIKP